MYAKSLTRFRFIALLNCNLDLIDPAGITTWPDRTARRDSH